MKIEDYPASVTKKEQYTTTELAHIFRVSHRTAGIMIDEGLIDGYTIPGGKTRRVRHDAVIKYVNSNPKFAYALQHITEPS